MFGSCGVSRARAIAAAALCVGALVAFPGAAHALNGSKYCSAGSDATKTGDTVPGSLLSVNDVTLWTGSVHSASDCYGDFDPGNSSPSNETAALNEIFRDISGAGEFIYLDKTGDPSNANGLNGIKLVVQTYGGSDGAPGFWTVVWTDTNGNASQNLPLKVDLAILLVGGNYSAAYLLSGVLLEFAPGIGIGTFDIQFSNGGGIQVTRCYDNDGYDHDDNSHHSGYKKYKDERDKEHCDKPKQPTISHLLIAGRIVPTQVPEPATMAMFGVGLLGLWTLSGRRLR